MVSRVLVVGLFLFSIVAMAACSSGSPATTEAERTVEPAEPVEVVQEKDEVVHEPAPQERSRPPGEEPPHYEPVERPSWDQYREPQDPEELRAEQEKRREQSRREAEERERRRLEEERRAQEEAAARAPRELPDRDLSCQSDSDCTSMAIAPDCCPSCRDVAYNQESAREIRAYCQHRFSGEQMAQCPVLGCIREYSKSVYCREGICRVHY